MGRRRPPPHAARAAWVPSCLPPLRSSTRAPIWVRSGLAPRPTLRPPLPLPLPLPLTLTLTLTNPSPSPSPSPSPNPSPSPRPSPSPNPNQASPASVREMMAWGESHTLTLTLTLTPTPTPTATPNPNPNQASRTRTSSTPPVGCTCCERCMRSQAKGSERVSLCGARYEGTTDRRQNNSVYYVCLSVCLAYVCTHSLSRIATYVRLGCATRVCRPLHTVGFHLQNTVGEFAHSLPPPCAPFARLFGFGHNLMRKFCSPAQALVVAHCTFRRWPRG